jgi:pyruvate-ferredoxin/flavodoxin oxidoreductase
MGAAAALGAQADHRQEDPGVHAARLQDRREATDRGDLQLRMQGNAFLGAFFSVSPMLGEFGITPEQFRDAVHKQYIKKFGKLGDAVVTSNMEVMTKGLRAGARNQASASSRRRSFDAARQGAAAGRCPQHRAAEGQLRHRDAARIAVPEGQPERTPLTRVASSTRCSVRASATTSRHRRSRRSA